MTQDTENLSVYDPDAMILQGARQALDALTRPCFVLWGRDAGLYPNRYLEANDPATVAALRGGLSGALRTGLERVLRAPPAEPSAEVECDLAEGEENAASLVVRLRPLRGDGELALGCVGEVVDVAREGTAPTDFHASVLNCIGHLVWLAGDDGAVHFMNEKANDFAGFTRREDGGIDWRGILHPDDLEQTEKAWREAVRTGEPYQCEHRLRQVDGGFRWYRSRALLHHGSPSEKRWYGTATDIQAEVEMTEALRESEGRFRALADGIPLMLWLHDAEGKQILVNQTYCDYFRVASMEMTGEHWKSLVHPEDLEPYLAAFKACLREQREFKEEVRVRRAGDDGWRTIASWGKPLRSENGVMTGYIGASADITDRKQMELELKNAKAEAEASNRTKSEFLANMSHEIRTPMTAILGYTDILASQVEDSQSLEYLGIIKRNGHFLLELINDILDLSKIEANKLKVSRQTVPLIDFSRDVRSLLESKALEKGLALALEFETPLPPRVTIDPVRVRQVLINLIGNAIKFTAKGRITLRVACDAEDRLVWSVEDTGIGIPEAEQARLFEPFHQVDGSSTRSRGGTGLGLAICRRLVAQMDGFISCESEEGVGTVFRFGLPGCFSPDTLSLESIPEAAPPAPPSSGGEGPRLHGRYLVVDDREEVRALHEHCIREAGGRSLAAESGQEALAWWSAQKEQGDTWQGILMDVQMPGMDGLETTRRLRRAGCHLPILALTAHAMAGDEEKCLEAGCDAYLSKPVNSPELVAVLQRLATAKTPPGSALGSVAATDGDEGHRLLIVEDSASLRLVLQQLFSRSGFSTRTASTVKEALEVARDFRPRLVLADLGLPDCSGLELPARLRDLLGATDVRCVALSGRDEPEEHQRSLDHGFDDHVVKPPDFNALRRRLRELSEPATDLR